MSLMVFKPLDRQKTQSSLSKKGDSRGDVSLLYSLVIAIGKDDTAKFSPNISHGGPLIGDKCTPFITQGWVVFRHTVFSH